MKHVTLVLAFAILSVAAMGSPSEAATKTADASAGQADPATSQKVTVISVKGSASYRHLAEKDSKWKKLQAGDKLGELCVIRTGFGAKVELEFADRGRWTVKSSSKFGIREYTKKGNHVKAHLGLKYGYIDGKIDSSRGTNDFRVTTPVATLAATGTGANIGYTGDRGMGAYGTHGSWNMGTAMGSRNLAMGQRTDGKRTLSSFILMQQLAAGLSPKGQTGIERMNTDDNSGGRGLMFLGGGKTKLIISPMLPPSHYRIPIPPPGNGHSSGH